MRPPDPARIRTIEEFKGWTRAYLRPILPHEAAIFGLGYFHAGGVGLDYLLTVDYPRGHIDSVRNSAGAIDTPIVRRWLATLEPQIFEAKHPWPDTPAHWLESFRRHGLRNALAHARIDPARCVGTYYSFYQLPASPGAREIEILERLMPSLHEALFRLLGHGPKTRAAQALGLLSERQQALIGWLRLGKTNAEIAVLTGASENTVKHGLSDLYDRLEVSNRAGLLGLLIEHETGQAPASQTRIF